jgi:hypothetical protein
MAASEKVRSEVDHHDRNPDVGTAIQLSHEADEKESSPWTWSMFRLYLVLSCAYLCGCLVCPGISSYAVNSSWLTRFRSRTAMMAHSWVV